jgi:hypothetical protein
MPGHSKSKTGRYQVSAEEKLSPNILPPEDDHDVIYALRTAQQHQVQLSLIADQKANIIIGVALIVFSILQTQIFDEQLVFHFHLLPLYLLALSVGIAFFLAIVVVLPRINTHAFRKPEEMPNPLFFGFFTYFSEDEFTAYLMQRLQSNPAARELLLRDMYQIGVVLQKKYRLLRYSYLFLGLGAVLSVAAFLLILAL